MKTRHAARRNLSRDLTSGNGTTRSAVGYIRVSTDMQAADGLSLDAQTATIEQCCAMQGFRRVQIYKDVLSGGKSDRPGLQEVPLNQQSWLSLAIRAGTALSRASKSSGQI